MKTKVRVVLRVPNRQFVINKDEPLVDYAVGHKYLVK